MFKKIISYFLLCLLLTACFFLYLGCGIDSALVSGRVFSTNNATWEKVRRLEEKGLTESVLKELESIYSNAKLNKNYPELIKAIFYQMRFSLNIEEADNTELLRRLKQDIETVEDPAKNILQSALAELLLQYYKNNLYTFRSRTQMSGQDNDDISAWDSERLLREISKYYLLSLENSEKLKEIPIEKYGGIIVEGNSRDLRPFLYDFLAHRALDFFMSGVESLTQPAYHFQVDEKRLFTNGKKFSRMAIKTQDTDSLQYKSLLILQDLLAFHQKDKDPGAFIHVDLTRLRFIKNIAVGPEAEERYLKALGNLRDKYKKDPASAQVSYEIALFHYNQGAKYEPLDSDLYKWELKKAMEICGKTIEKSPGTEGAINCGSLISIIGSKELSFAVERANTPGAPFRALLDYKNCAEVFFKIIPLSKDEREKAKKIEYNGENKDLVNYYLSLTEADEFKVDLPDDGDFQSHAVEVKMPALNLGYYIILASPYKDFRVNGSNIFYSPVWITRISFLNSDDYSGRSSYYCFDRDTGEPLAGLTARIYEYSWDYNTRKYFYKKEESYTTDANGYFESAKFDSRDFAVEFTYNEDTLLFDDNFYQYRYDEYEENTKETIFFTDRAIYRPGQTIYFKGIVFTRHDKYGAKKSLEKNFKTTITLFDVNGQAVGNQVLTTNDYGSFSGFFTAPADRLNGEMYIANASGTSYFSVEEYKRPKFEVIFPPVEKSIKLGRKVFITGSARAFAGFPVTGAVVSYRVLREISFPYWNGRYRPKSSEQIQIKRGRAETDAKGEFVIDFNAIPDLSIPEEEHPVFYYTVYADVTDINGETHSSQTEIRVGYADLSISVDIPSVIAKEGPHDFKIKSLNLNDQEIAAKGEISISLLQAPNRLFRQRLWHRPDRFILTKDEYYTLFPYDVYDNEDSIYTWPKVKEVAQIGFNTSGSKQLVLEDMSSWPQGRYVLELKTKDQFGYPVTLIRYFTLYSSLEENMPVNEATWFAPVKVEGQPGEFAKIEIGSSAEIHVICEIELKGNIVKKELFNIRGQREILNFPITKECRGGFSVHLFFVKHNRAYIYEQPIEVSWKNKQLKLEFETFRDKISPGTMEEWRIKITRPDTNAATAEMAATLYDASLDTFRVNSWPQWIYPYFYTSRYWYKYVSFQYSRSRYYDGAWNMAKEGFERDFDNLDFFGLTLTDYRSRYLKSSYAGAKEQPLADLEEETTGKSKKVEEDFTIPAKYKEYLKEGENEDSLFRESPEPVYSKVRTNLNETAFFYPHLMTDKEGRIIISFTAPEALTRWKMLGFAHTKELEYGYLENEVITQKELMVIPNIPRFFRENDSIKLTTKVTNISEKQLKGSAGLLLFNPYTMESVDSEFNNTSSEVPFSVDKGGSALLEWNLTIPGETDAVVVRITAQAGDFTDGEEIIVPVLPNTILTTETLPLLVRGKETKEFKLAGLLESEKSATIKHQRLTLEFTTNPVWNAVQALPYLMEFPYECSEQIFSRFYANSIAKHIAESSPRIAEVFENWKGRDTLKSNLEKNEELKSLILSETPWVLQSQDEADRRKRVGHLFDKISLEKEITGALLKLIEAQNPNGGWSWFSGLPDDRYITQHIIAGLGHMDKLKIRSIRNDVTLWGMITKAVDYLDKRMEEDYLGLLKNNVNLNEKNIGDIQCHFLYARSFFNDIKISDTRRKAFAYWQAQAGKYWPDFNRYSQGMTALASYRMGNEEKAREIAASLKENAVKSKGQGMYWKSVTPGYSWFQAPVETQALLIEVFSEVVDDREAVEEMKIWLLRQKETQGWKTTKATAEACYALLLQGYDLLASDEQVEIDLGNLQIDSRNLPDGAAEAGTGYLKTSWGAASISADMGEVVLKKTGPGIALGALYWQYFTELDKITSFKTPLKITRGLFLKEISSKGPVLKSIEEGAEIKPGDLLIVRIGLEVDRDMEYIHMKDMRASALEPENVISKYKYQDGLWYYESVKDGSTNFFFPRLPKGKYIFEYPLRVTHAGDFSDGIATIQSMYAPKFAARSSGIRLRIGP